MRTSWQQKKDEQEIDPGKWKLWFNEASNLLENGIGAVLASLKGQYFPFLARLGFDCTNNMAEYKACAMGITMAIEHQISKHKVFGDSVLVIYQLRGECETRDAKLIPYHAHIMALSEHFDEISFHYVPRDENQMVDALATLSAMLQANQNKEMTIHFQQQTDKLIFSRLNNVDSLSARCRVALNRDWSDMFSAKPYLTRSQLSADRHNIVRLTLFRTKMQEIRGWLQINDGSPLLAKKLRIKSTRVRWQAKRSPLTTFGLSVLDFAMGRSLLGCWAVELTGLGRSRFDRDDSPRSRLLMGQDRPDLSYKMK
ncbi:hypothetical protein CR513_28217, partial [Mucuna pruriens]